MTAMMSDFARAILHAVSKAAAIGQNAIEKLAASDRRFQPQP